MSNKKSCLGRCINFLYGVGLGIILFFSLKAVLPGAGSVLIGEQSKNIEVQVLSVDEKIFGDPVAQVQYGNRIFNLIVGDKCAEYAEKHVGETVPAILTESFYGKSQREIHQVDYRLELGKTVVYESGFSAM